MKRIFGSFIFLFSSLMYSQVGINTETPQATLDVQASPANGSTIDGIIAPRLTGVQLKSKDSLYREDQTGTIIYALSASPDAGVSGKKTINVTTEGYYYFDGSIWVKFTSGSASDVSQPVTAANGLTKSGDNIQMGGTLVKNTDIATDGNNITFSGTGNFGIGTTSPTHSLDVNGSGGIREKLRVGNSWNEGGALSVKNNVATEPISTFVDSDGSLKAILLNDGNWGLGTGQPTERLDVGGNIRFRGVPNQTTLDTDDRMLVLQNDGTGKKISLSTLKSEIDTNTNIYTNNGTLTENRTVFLGGNSLNFGGAGSVGVGVAEPTEKLDVAGTMRLRNIPSGKTDDMVLVVASDGVIKKSSLPPSSSFVLFDTNSNTVTRSADNIVRPLAFEGSPNKIYPDYIEKINNTTYKAKKRGVYTIEAVIKYIDIPASNEGVRVGCRAGLNTGPKILNIIGDRWNEGGGTTTISRSVILNEGDEISVTTGCNRPGNQTYKTDSGSTLFITFLPL